VVRCRVLCDFVSVTACIGVSRQFFFTP
jgi:hypothetical protein